MTTSCQLCLCLHLRGQKLLQHLKTRKPQANLRIKLFYILQLLLESLTSQTCFLSPRTLEVGEVVSETPSLCLHLGPTFFQCSISHRLHPLLDTVVPTPPYSHTFTITYSPTEFCLYVAVILRLPMLHKAVRRR